MLRRTLAGDGYLDTWIASLTPGLTCSRVGHREWRLRLGKPSHPT